MRSEPDGLEFPCRWPVKAMTRTDEKALAQVVDAVAGAGGTFRRDEVTVRPSRNGRYQAVTVVVEADSRDRLERIYGALRALDIVEMTL